MFNDDKEFKFPGLFGFMFKHPGASAAISLGVTCALFVGALLAIKVIFF